MMIRALIIEDEADGREALQLAIEKYCPGVTIVAICASAKEGINAIGQQQPDIVFLDIQMPHMSGFEMLEKIEVKSFEVIFVTAHDHYAIKAIRFSALDYLLKPINPIELQAAVDRMRDRLQQKQESSRFDTLLNNVKHLVGGGKKLAIPTFEGITFLNTDDIIYGAADGNYTKFFLTGQRHILVSKKLKEFELLLGENGFFRIHNAYLVNIRHVLKYIRGEGGYVELTEGHHADVSRRKKESFLQYLQRQV